MTLPVSPPYGHFALRGVAAGLARAAQRQPDNWLGRRIALGLRKLVLRNRVQVIDGDFQGLRIRWHPLDNVTDRHAYFFSGAWDRVEREYQDRHLPADGVYVDAGANSGLYSVLAARALDRHGTLLAIEPNPVMFERLCVNLALNPGPARLHLYPCGIAAREGSFNLALKPGNLGAATLADRPPSAETLQVQCRPLLDIVSEAGLERIDFLKIDIEGYEANALNPFFARAPRALWPRHVNVETPAGIDWSGLGYRVELETRQNTLFRRTGG